VVVGQDAPFPPFLCQTSPVRLRTATSRSPSPSMSPSATLTADPALICVGEALITPAVFVA
jgi:hypothetical protein